ncbi:hypothetical protein F5Y10DRAFT_266422 [Nemania abortiva]|nr:hypothetical protein F5Y10DRAFT_266422 [Nemania abortiva]
MAIPGNRHYQQFGVLIPWVDSEEQWSVDGIYEDNILGKEVRISTAPNAEIRLPGKLDVRGRSRIFFNEIEFWQALEDSTYSIYTTLYNGDTVRHLVNKYNSRDRRVPEHFIWHLLLTLVEAVRYLKFGALPGTDDEDPDWIPIHHRDIVDRNVFIHYASNEEPEPEEGFEENAFPEVILGDFGCASREGDPPDTIAEGEYLAPGVLAEYHDVYSIFIRIAKKAMLAGTGRYGLAEESRRIRNMNRGRRAGDPPCYSDELIEMIEHFEYPNCVDDHDVTNTPVDEDGVEQQPNHSFIPSMRRVVDEFLPIMRDRVRRYRKPAGGIPAGWWQQFDVSWTKPNGVMPYQWKPTDPANANAFNQDPNQVELVSIRDLEREYSKHRHQHRVLILIFPILHHPRLPILLLLPPLLPLRRRRRRHRHHLQEEIAEEVAAEVVAGVAVEGVVAEGAVEVKLRLLANVVAAHPILSLIRTIPLGLSDQGGQGRQESGAGNAGGIIIDILSIYLGLREPENIRKHKVISEER